MPVVETRIQHEYIMKFFCRTEAEGELGYRETSPNIVSEDMFIPSKLAEFVRTGAPLAWKVLMSRHHQDEMKLQEALMDFVKERLLNASNSATFLNQNKKRGLRTWASLDVLNPHYNKSIATIIVLLAS